MIKFNVDPKLRARLTASGKSLEICDESGRTIGYFQPVMASGDLKKLSPYADAEIEQKCSQREGRPLSEIWKDLESGSRS